MPSTLESFTPLSETFDQQSSLRSISTLDNGRAASSLIKRTFDILFAMFGLIVTGPILLLACLAIVMESSGSPIFIQRRVGRKGRIFNIYKLRSMRSVRKESCSNGFKTAKDDQRLTRVGLFLRLTNLDELPQLINILLGDMSLIGPRPLSVDETEHIKGTLQVSPAYAGFAPQSRPGLVGLEQINRTRELTYLERFEYNHEYEATWSPWLDLQIFARSVFMCKHVSIAGGIGLVALLVVSLQLFHVFG
jgi:lipopolysaccharide/colanic/teichoic acid biosynthesis glycosyltransferase